MAQQKEASGQKKQASQTQSQSRMMTKATSQRAENGKNEKSMDTKKSPK
jgi:hypothetical protein